MCRLGYRWSDGGTHAFPIVRLTYDPARTDKKFNGLSEPVEVVANHIVKPVWAGIDGGNAFPRVEDFVQHVNTQYAGASPVPKGTNGIYSSPTADVFAERFQKKDDRALSVTRAPMSVISMRLPVDPVTKTRQYDIDRHAHDFANSLPPMYDTDDHKAQFRYFIENYGTSYAVSATLGGLVEQYASWKTWLTDPLVEGGPLSKEALVRNAGVDFAKATGLPGPATHDSTYNENTVNVSPLFCKGGDASVSCEDSLQKWASTISESPVLLDYELAPISDLVEDPNVKASLDQAVKEYLQEKAAEWSAVPKCPVNCGPPGAGECKGSASSCTCTFNGRIGRMCSGCAPVPVTATFEDPSGKKSTATQTLACDNSFHTVWSGNGGDCNAHVQIGRSWGRCTCSPEASVSCRRNELGNLQSKLVKATAPAQQKVVNGEIRRRPSALDQERRPGARTTTRCVLRARKCLGSSSILHS